jgi:hypothetical protein
MATPKHQWTYADTRPVLTATLGGADCDLTGAVSVRFLLRAADGTSPLIDDTDHTSVVSATAPKQVRFTPFAEMWGDDGIDGPGNYRAQFEITQDDLEVITYPNKGFISVIVQAGLDDTE